MTTSHNTPHTRRTRRGPISVFLIAAFAGGLLAASGTTTGPLPGLEGRDANQHDSRRPKITAAFPRESYRPGAKARLLLHSRANRVTLQFFRAGSEKAATKANDLMLGAPVTRPVAIGRIRPGRVLRLRIGVWPSGFYFARLTAASGRIGFAPFVLRPRRLGEHRVAVVLPTQTWQAYNYRDDDGDGDEDSWYSGGNTARLGRPYLNRGVPYHFKHYDAPFLRWLARTGRQADYLSDADLSSVASGRVLARRYALIVFPGHHEYVTENEYDVVTTFRNRGGNLMFLSANNFFWKVRRSGNLMTRVKLWRDLGRPEAALIGVQYIGNNSARRSAWIVRDRIPWMFEGTGLHRGSRLASGGIEGDAVTARSPRGTRVVAEIPDLFGPGRSAQMTYYERGGAKVFAAGAFTMAGSVRLHSVQILLGNLWSRLALDGDTGPTVAP